MVEGDHELVEFEKFLDERGVGNRARQEADSKNVFKSSAEPHAPRLHMYFFEPADQTRHTFEIRDSTSRWELLKHHHIANNQDSHKSASFAYSGLNR